MDEDLSEYGNIVTFLESEVHTDHILEVLLQCTSTTSVQQLQAKPLVYPLVFRLYGEQGTSGG